MRKFLIYISIVLIFFSCSESAADKEKFSNEDFRELIIESIQLGNELNFEAAFNKLALCLREAKQQGNIEYEIVASINLGLLYHKFNDREQALSYYLTVLDLINKYKKEEFLNAVYNNVGIIYSENKNFIEADNYFRKALWISNKQGKEERVAMNLINIANIKKELNELDSALFYNYKALEILELNHFDDFQATAYNNIGEIQLLKKQFEAANSNFINAITLELKNGDLTNFGFFELNLGKSFVLLLQYDSAKTHLENALFYLKKMNNSEALSDCYYYLSKNELQLNNSKLALEFFDQSLAWKDTLLFQSKDKWISETKIKYELGKIEKENEFLEEKSILQRRIIYFIIFLSVLFILFLISIWRTRNKSLKQKNIILTKEKELAQVLIEKNEVQKLKLKEEMENQQKLSEIKQHNIELELEHKNKEVVSKAIHLMNKNEILSSLYDLVKEINIGSDDPNKKTLEKMSHSIKKNLDQDKDWEDFKLHFEKVHQSFIKNLNAKHPELSPTDLRLCAYLLIDLSPKEIANISNISPESVRKRKQRLRDKMGIEASNSLEEYLKSL